MTPAASRARADVFRETRTERKSHVHQGQYKISSRDDAVFSTILGSCVAVCLHDPIVGVGGMNHFLVPGGDRMNEQSLSHGAYSMELLINGMLKRGADRNRIVAKLFGGAAVMSGLSNIGQQNAAFAAEFLIREKIECIGKSLGGDSARRVNFWPCSGRARQLLIPIDEAPDTEKSPTPQPPSGGSDVELF